jgi:hypothetical protein
MVDANAVLPRRDWLEAFLLHVAEQDPGAALPLVAGAAARLFALLGHFDPVDVAEAEWEGLPLRERRSVARDEPSGRSAGDVHSFGPFDLDGVRFTPG